MTEINGGFVTRAELAAHLGPMRDDIKEIRGDVKELLRSQAGGSALSSFGRWLLPVLVSVCSSSLVAYLIVGH